MKGILKVVPLDSVNEGMAVCYELEIGYYVGGKVSKLNYRNTPKFIPIATYDNCSASILISELKNIVCEYTYKDGTIQQVPLSEEDYGVAIDKIGTEVDFEMCVANSASGSVYPLRKCKLL